MRGLMAAMTLIGLLASSAVRAEGPVVVELFTSQGCSSCPPADEMLVELAQRDDVIALGLHVDYWDYIGWADAFAQPGFTSRQQSYAVEFGDRMVYTPQFVVGGRARIVGAKPMQVMQAVLDQTEAPSSVGLEVTRDGDTLRISARSLAADPTPMLVQLVRYHPEKVVEIERGENAGKRLRYANVVTSWQVLVRWTGADDLVLDAPVPGEDRSVVIVQADGPGAILASAALR